MGFDAEFSNAGIERFAVAAAVGNRAIAAFTMLL